MTSQITDLPIRQPATDGVSTLYGISWQDFKDLEQKLSRSGNRVKLSYLRGVLEIVSPIEPQHENVKRTLNLLLEAYMREKGIRFYSQFLPELDPSRLIPYLNYADQYDAVEDFTDEVRKGNI